MKPNAVNPTLELYSQIQAIAEHFNKELFGGGLPPAMFVLERGKNTSGYFSPSRWRHNDGEEVGEIALNPSYFADQPIIHLFQTIVHEQCHLWQYKNGHKVRKSYHDDRWSKKMIEVGLMPSSTGAPGGSRTGQKMSDYPIEDGEFLIACTKLMRGDTYLLWVDQGANSKPLHRRTEFENLRVQSGSRLYVPVRDYFPNFKPLDRNEIATQKQKIKYQCLSCRANVWGKNGLAILCGNCDRQFEQLL